MIRRQGQLPDDSPPFDTHLDRDLLDYGYSLMSASIQILDAERSVEGDRDETGQTESRDGFLQASYALEAATRNADPQLPGLDFHRLIAGAASHLAGYAARAYSLVDASRASGRLSPMELTLADLVLRNLNGIEARTRRLRSAPEVDDSALRDALVPTSRDGDAEDTSDEDASSNANAGSAGSGAAHSADDTPGDAGEPNTFSSLGPITLLLSEQYLVSVAEALFAIAFGRRDLLDRAIAGLQRGEDATNEIGAPGPWWVFRLTRHMVWDLDSTSIRRNLPTQPPSDEGINETHDFDLDDDAADTEPADGQANVASLGEDHVGAHPLQVSVGVETRWQRLRRTYVASLLRRSRAEIDLWPSQLHVVDRIFADDGDLVVALPTSAGKTRIAELCILRCLAQQKRAVYVTPLRALSAQTERILERTFAPLGCRVSSLYGSMGANDLDGDALRTSDIVVATPEKLDFALRSEPSVLDDVGVIVLDEGHMIGTGEREIRYEAQIQRLLRRTDAHNRRIVCLSAVFPDNDQLTDFVNWITDDASGGLHRENWRPTRQQFGLVTWRETGHARLDFTVGDERPFIPRFLEAKKPSGRRKREFPATQNEMTLATAWRLVDEGQTVLIFCPQRRSVTALASLVVKLHEQKLIESLAPDDAHISTAVAVGTEWFGANHEILQCLRLGVAIHHGALPGPFRREVEALLHRRILQVTIASPTLAQGLDLSASVVLFSSLHRNQELLSGAEFANVIGRAGRAFVDTEGLVLYPMFEPKESKRRNWLRLTKGTQTRALESGLLIIGTMLIEQIESGIAPRNLAAFIDYLTGSDWSFPVSEREASTDHEAEQTWDANLRMLDTAILSVLGDEGGDAEDIVQVLADTMRDSLWERQLHRLNSNRQQALRAVIGQRTQYLWDSSTPEQRRGWYLAGLGAAAGHELTETAGTIVHLTHTAELAITQGDAQPAVDALLELAEVVFSISIFKPRSKVNDWRTLFQHWITGIPLSDADENQMDVAEFIEQDIIYLLVWGIEAARVHEFAHSNPVAQLINGSATAALETGTLSQAAAVLLRSGFDHRAAALKAVKDISADFTDSAGLRAWVGIIDPKFANDPTWPSSASRDAWVEFTRRLRISRRRHWSQYTVDLGRPTWFGEDPKDDDLLRITGDGPGAVALWSPGFKKLGVAAINLNADRQGVLHAKLVAAGSVQLRYRGPDDLLASRTGST